MNVYATIIDPTSIPVITTTSNNAGSTSSTTNSYITTSNNNMITTNNMATTSHSNVPVSEASHSMECFVPYNLLTQLHNNIVELVGQGNEWLFG